MATERTAITMPGDLLRDVTRQSRRAGISRSRYISEILRAHLQRKDKQEMITQIAAAYAKADSREDALVKDAKERFGDIVEDSW